MNINEIIASIPLFIFLLLFSIIVFYGDKILEIFKNQKSNEFNEKQIELKIFTKKCIILIITILIICIICKLFGFSIKDVADLF